MSSLKEELEDLVQHPGYLWLRAQELEHWREQLSTYIGQAANDPNDTLALQKIRQVVAAQRAVEQVFSRPKSELDRLKGAEPQPLSHSRRGLL